MRAAGELPLREIETVLHLGETLAQFLHLGEEFGIRAAGAVPDPVGEGPPDLGLAEEEERRDPEDRADRDQTRQLAHQ